MTAFYHFNFNVLDLDRSIAFYQEALGLEIVRTKEGEDGTYTLVFLGEKHSPFQLELTYIKGRTQPYNLGECEFHLAFRTDEFDALHEKHKEMGIICFENPKVGVYFICDPDGYWIEIVPEANVPPRS